jgi:lipoate---protein ligase
VFTPNSSNEVKFLRQEDLPQGFDPMGEAILQETSPPIKVWEPQSQCIVLGNSQKPAIEIDLDYWHQHPIPIYKRRGGGGCVVLYPGTLCVAVKLNKRQIQSVTEYFNDVNHGIMAFLKHTLGLESSDAGISDLAVCNKKILGCSLYLSKHYALYLASLLVSHDLSPVFKYLQHPSKEPSYRAGRPHSDFVTSLNILGCNTSAQKLVTPLTDWLYQHTTGLAHPSL